MPVMGHQVYWETCGNPNGKPALALHGGPLIVHEDNRALTVLHFPFRELSPSVPGRNASTPCRTEKKEYQAPWVRSVHF
jgi:hypothetical protein